MKRRIEIKKWLLDVGLTQADIARQTGASGTLVSRVISGERGIKGKKGIAIKRHLAALGCPEVPEVQDNAS